MRRKDKDTEKEVSDVESWNMKEQIQMNKFVLYCYFIVIWIQTWCSVRIT